MSSPRGEKKNFRGPPRTRGYDSSEETPEEAEQQQAQPQQQYADPQPRQKRRQNTLQRRGPASGPLDQLPVDGVGQTVGNVTGAVTDTLGGLTGQALDKKGGGDKKSDTLRLRLDLNLDVEITLKARIHGDLELALLN